MKSLFLILLATFLSAHALADDLTKPDCKQPTVPNPMASDSGQECFASLPLTNWTERRKGKVTYVCKIYKNPYIPCLLCFLFSLCSFILTQLSTLSTPDPSQHGTRRNHHRKGAHSTHCRHHRWPFLRTSPHSCPCAS